MSESTDLLDLLLMVRDDCMFDNGTGYYVLRPHTVTTLLERAIERVEVQVKREQREHLRELTVESEALGLYEH